MFYNKKYLVLFFESFAGGGWGWGVRVGGG